MNYGVDSTQRLPERIAVEEIGCHCCADACDRYLIRASREPNYVSAF